MIDTENRSASLYRGATVDNLQIGKFMVGNMTPPFSASAYVEAIHAAENAGAEVIIVDSMTHAWSGEGGALDKQGKIAARTGNSYTAWRDITPEQNRLMDTILQSKCHIISDFRAKQEFVQEKNANGKTVVRNIGMGLIYRDNAEYEYTTVFMLDEKHIASTTKDRTSMFDGQYFVITPEVGAKIAKWLKSDAAEFAAVPETVKGKDSLTFETDDTSATSPSVAVTVEMVNHVIRNACEGLDPEGRNLVTKKIKEITGGTANYLKITDPDVLSKLYEQFAK